MNVYDSERMGEALAADGYLGELYTPYSRYWYVSVRKTF